MRFRMIALAMLFSAVSVAQDQAVVDSIQAVIDKAGTAEERIDAMIELAFYLEVNDPQQAIAICDEVIKQAKNEKLYALYGEGFKTRAEVNRITGNQVAALADFKQAIEIADQYNLQRLKATALNSLGVLYKEQGDTDTGISVTNEALQINIETGDDASAAACYNNLGELYRLESRFDSAMVYYNLSLELNEKVGSKLGIADCYNNMGIVYDYMGEFDNAIAAYLDAIRLYDELKDTEGRAGTMVNVGIIYVYQGNYDKAVESFTDARNLYSDLNSTYGHAFAVRGLAWVASEKGDYQLSIELFLEVLELRMSISDSLGMTDAYTSLAWLYAETDQLNLAIENLELARSIQESTRNTYTLIYTLTTEADILFRQGKYDDGLKLLHEAVDWAIETNVLNEQRFAYKSLADGYAQAGDYKSAYEYHQTYFAINDSIVGVESTNKVHELEELYNAEKRELEIDNLNKDNALIKAENEQRRILIWGLSGGIALVLFAVVVLIRSVIRKRKDNEIILKQKQEVEHQRDLVEEKNTEILDSINYARRLQEAILPPQRVVKEYLQQSFILYKPKDIVAGDFYWMETINDTVYFAAADCTGHGVPGAMVSVVCSNALTKALIEEGITEPGKILDRAKELVIERFGRGEEEVKDGMDISLCALDLNKNTVQWSGANNPLWIIRSDASDVEEVKPNKQPIGKYFSSEPFTTHMVSLGKDDALYIFSDGFADQFGGDKGKKFKVKPFKELLLSIQNKPMEQQRSLINDSFESWRGDIEQVDDVCVIGVKI